MILPYNLALTFFGLTILCGIGLSPVWKESLSTAIVLLIVFTPALIVLHRVNNKHNRPIVNTDPFTSQTQPYRLFAAACLAYFISSSLAFTFEDANTQLISDFDLPSRFLIIPLLGLLLLKYTQYNIFPTSWLCWAFFVAAITAFSIAIYQKYFTDMSTITGGTTHHILFGGLSAMIAVTCLALPHKLKWLSTIGFILAATASLLSTSRGAWPALILIGVIHPIMIYKKSTEKTFSSKTQLIAIIIACFLLFSFLITIPSIGVTERVTLAMTSINNYFSHDIHISSIGLRFEMWKGALIIFKEHWILGVGLEEYEVAIQQLEQQQQIRSLTNMHMHPHNDLLNELTTKGILGGISYIAVITVPAYYFISSIITSEKLQKERLGLLLAGLYTSITFTIAGLSEALLTRNLSTTYYLFSITILYTSLQRTTNRCS